MSLSVAGATGIPGAERSYTVRAVNEVGPGVQAETTGARSAGELVYRWQRSSGDADGDYEPLDGAWAATHEDTTAPSDGSPRWYRCLVGAVGIPSEPGVPARGFRAPFGSRYVVLPAAETGLAYGLFVKATEVTQQEWMDVTGIDEDHEPSQYRQCDNTCPVERVDWHASVAFANALSAREGLESCYVLPECADELDEWKVGDTLCTANPGDAVVAVPDCTGYRLDDDAIDPSLLPDAHGIPFFEESAGTMPLDPLVDLVAWYGGNSEVSDEWGWICDTWYVNSGRCGPHPVGGKAPDRWGRFDVYGNVFELEWSVGDSTLRATGGSWSNEARYVVGFDVENGSAPFPWVSGPIVVTWIPSETGSAGLRPVRTCPDCRGVLVTGRVLSCSEDVPPLGVPALCQQGNESELDVDCASFLDFPGHYLGPRVSIVPAGEAGPWASYWTEPDGGFSLVWYAGVAGAIEVEAPMESGYTLRASAALAAATEGDVIDVGDLLLSPHASLIGTVVGPDGASPVAGAEVVLSETDGDPSTTAVSSADGTFEILGVPPGDYLVDVTDGATGDELLEVPAGVVGCETVADIGLLRLQSP